MRCGVEAETKRSTQLPKARKSGGETPAAETLQISFEIIELFPNFAKATIYI